MRPLRLRMKGFGTFREETEVDFKGLELVALVGSTGSGKSTIIDALTFALYGSVVRLDDERAVAPVINQVSTEARVALDFELGAAQYSATRIVRRTAAGGATTKEARLERGEEVLADTARGLTEKVEEILGLNFERFTKIVVLPQGKFASFLHDKTSDRQLLLTELLDLGVYKQVGAVARDIATTDRTTLEALRPGLESRGVTDEQIAALEARAGELATFRIEVGVELDALAKADADRGRLNELTHDYGVLVWAVALVQIPDDVATLGANIETAAANQGVAKAKLDDASKAFDEADGAMTAGPKADACRRLLTDHETLASLTTRLADLEKRADAAATEVDASCQARAEVEAQISDAESARRMAQEAENSARSAREAGPNPGELARIRQQRVDLDDAAARVKSLELEVTDYTAKETAAQKRADAAGSERERADLEVRKLESTKGAKALVNALVVGDECPVCRRTVESLPDHDIDAEVKAAADASVVATATANEKSALLDQAKSARQQSAAKLQAESERRAKLAAALADAPDSDELDALDLQVRELADRAQSAAEERETADLALANLREAETTQQVVKRAGLAEKAQVQLVAELGQAQKQRAELTERLKDEAPPAELRQMIITAEELANDRLRAQRHQRNASEELEDTAREVESWRTREREARALFDQIRDPLAHMAPPTPGSKSLLADWIALVDWSVSKRLELEAHHGETEAELAAAAAAIEQRRSHLAALCSPHLDDPAALIVDDGLDRLRDRVAHVAATAATQFEGAQRLREELAETRRKVEELEVSAQVYRDLGQMLRAENFERWLLGEVMDLLVDRASKRLYELSKEQYSLEVDDMDFKVRDHRNGDELRGAKTLSGGETFLASLALSLALAESIAEMAPEGSPRLESLFLDEGFGTLDPDFLDIVAGAIEDLSASGRMVGIITHIRELADRMPARLEVSKGASTSTVERVEA